MILTEFQFLKDLIGDEMSQSPLIGSMILTERVKTLGLLKKKGVAIPSDRVNDSHLRMKWTLSSISVIVAIPSDRVNDSHQPGETSKAYSHFGRNPL